VITAEVKDNKLVITADIEAGRPSKSGKTLIVATTNGFVPVADYTMSFSLNVTKPKGG